MRKALLFLLCISFISCGYVAHSTLPKGVKIAVPVFKNSTYKEGVEVKVGKEVIKKFINEGTEVVGSPDNADFLLSGTLIAYEKKPLRWVKGIEEEIEEYRLILTAHITYKDLRTNEVLLDTQVSGDTDYFIRGNKAKDEESAVEEAAQDLAKNIVDAICEQW
ncbi:MAG: hypothetical protein DRP75_01135 [Candidatus Omnitrophota bacterium]|nr:MAG: hypothetical protein DRP75_01135 [Candidatus Omnitrophota bacterium]